MSLFVKLFISFAKIGCLAYGGGPSMIPLMQAEVVDTWKWMSPTDFIDALAMGYSLPGPIVTKISAVVGYRVLGIPGAIVAVLAVILPSIFMMMLLFLAFTNFGDNPRVQGMLKGIRPVILALLALVVWEMFPKAVTSPSTILLGILVFAALLFTNLHPAIAILAGGAIGMIFF